MSKVLVLGGGTWQIYLIDYLKKKGHHVTVVNPIRSATVDAADDFIQLDVKDVDGIVAAAANKFDYVTSDQSDVCSLPVAKVAERLGLRGNKPAVVEKFVNKYLMCQLAQSLGVLVPTFDKATNAEEVKAFGAKYGYPIIVKPADSTASRGFGVINSPDEAEAKVADCLRARMQVEYFVVQQCVSGTEVTVEGIVSGFKHRTLTSSSKEHLRAGVASSLWFPSDLDLSKLFQTHDHYISNSGLEFAITHAEYMIDGDRHWFIECGARGGGVGISSEVVPQVTGINLYDILLKGLQGEAVNLDSLQPTQRPTVVYFCEFPEGVVKDMAVPKDIPGLYSFIFNFKVNDYLKPAFTDSHRHSAAILVADTMEQLRANVKLMQESIKVEVE